MTLPEAKPPEPVALSERVSAEAERRLAELLNAVAARDNFIAVAAHELRNPMTPIIGQLELLLNGVRSGKYSLDEIERRIERIHRSMGHYLKRAATLLDVSRITSGNFKMAPVPCDLGEVVRLIAENLEETAKHAGASLKVEAPQNFPGT